MKAKILLVFLLFSKIAIAQNWGWVNIPIGGIGISNPKEICADSLGNSYIAGSFFDSLNLGSNIVLRSSRHRLESFLAKYDNTGKILWANKVEGKNDLPSDILEIGIDDSLNSYAVGEFADTLEIASSVMVSSTYIDSCFNEQKQIWEPCLKYMKAMFLAKFNFQGKVVWLKKIGESKKGNEINASAISIDPKGNCYITGSFSDTLNLNNQSIIVSRKRTTDMFLCKTDYIGQVSWIKAGGGEDPNADLGIDVSVDYSGNSYVTGFFRETANFDTYSLTVDTNGVNMFVAKYNTSGNCLWVKKGGGNMDKLSIEIDQNRNCYITGNINSEVNFDTVNLTTEKGNIFIVKYDTNGKCIWANTAGGYYFSPSSDISVDKLGNIYITGAFHGIVNFDNIQLKTEEEHNLFLAKYNSNGSVVWALQGIGVGIQNQNYGEALAIGKSGDIFLMGNFSGKLTLGSNSYTGSPGTNIFITMLNDKLSSIQKSNEDEFTVLIFPNPISDQITLNSEKVMEDATLSIYNLYGEKIKEIKNISGHTLTFSRGNLPSGLYAIQITENNKFFTIDKVLIIDN